VSITWRKSKSGEWVVCGPVDDVRVGVVTVTKRSGVIEHVEIEKLGRPFQTDDGRTLVYGYWPESSPQGERRFREGFRASGSRWCVNNAPESHNFRCGRSQSAVDSSGIKGMVCERCSNLPRWELSFC